MDNFAAAIAAIEDMKREGVVEDYALGGAMAMIFWSEPIATFDLDVFVRLRDRSLLVSLEPIYQWASARGYASSKEHIEIEGLPVQLLPAPNELAEEAITNAEALDYEGQPVRVIRPEYLIAMWLEPSARTAKRVGRVRTLMEESPLDRELLNQLAERYNFSLPSE